MNQPLICISCSSKPCEKTPSSTFDICKYGVAFLNNNGFVEKKEPHIPLLNIARNLRHEINPILHTIVEQTTKIDSSLSTKEILLDKPLSVIIGATVIVDNFIQMITGVHEFQTSPLSVSTKTIKVKDIINNTFNIYTILKEEERAKSLQLNNLVPEKYYVTKCSDFIVYILAVLIDNALKYSTNDSFLTINIRKLQNGKCEIKMTNESKTIPDSLNIFDLGVKANDKSKGFGYGLFWAKLLELHYNTITHEVENHENKFLISHNQIESNREGYAFQEFTLKNIILEER